MEQQNLSAGGTAASQQDSQTNPTPSQSNPTPSQPPLSNSQQLSQQLIPVPPRPSSVSNPNPAQSSIPMVTSNPQPQLGSNRSHPQAFSRPAWHHPHFSPSATSPPGSTLQSRAASPASGMAIGVPASSHTPLSTTSPFPSSLGQQQLGGLARSAPNLPEPVTASQARPGGAQGMGMVNVGNSSSSQIRPVAIGTSQLSRPVQPSPKPSTSTSNSLAPVSQNFQGHVVPRSPSIGSLPSSSPASSVPRTMTPVRQPWMNSGPQGKPPLPVNYRPQTGTQQVPVRSISTPLQQQQQSLPSTSLSPQQLPQSQHLPHAQHASTIHQPLEHHTQHFSSSKLPQAAIQSQQPVRLHNTANQKQAPATLPNTSQPVFSNKLSTLEAEEPCSRIISKRTIHDLVSQIDPQERLDPEVEDILVDIAEDFFNSITTFGCSLAKHRKSDRLEAKDILLHIERNWNITLPGFNGDEIKPFRKPILNETHRERIAVVKKSVQMSETVIAKNAANQVSGSGKSNQIKPTPSSVFSPNK